MASAPAPWGTCKQDGKEVQLLTLVDDSGASVKVATYGAVLVSLTVPDAKGQLDDVLLGFDDLEGYEKHTSYLGCAVGRVCSRIANGQFKLGEEVYTLPQNNGTNCLHGGTVGFNHYVWELVEAKRSAVTMRHVSPDKDQGFPGTMQVTAEYSLLPTNDGSVALKLRYIAMTDKLTVVNLTNHAYFNLAGNHPPMPTTALNHVVAIAADSFVALDERNIPLGELQPVEGTPFDFRTPTAIGARIEEKHTQLEVAQGYDHNFVLRDVGTIAGRVGGTRPLGVEQGAEGKWSRVRTPDAVAEDPSTGRRMEVYTSEPCVHMYSGNYLQFCGPPGKGGLTYERRGGFCFETQHCTDSPNQPSFPSIVLEPGQVWETETVFWFPRVSAA